ncbi:hypothetical protein F5X99DRAFT_424102 [Biscogniauxia marginata]|nr:hypothetical protein F5X99DRAFT_424102 [Biscogniauxia marginata]
MAEGSPSSSLTMPQQNHAENPTEDNFDLSHFSWWWWWWEIGGSRLSIISVSLIIPVLKQVDDKSIESWSRGPWGSFVLIVTGRLKVVTAWALSFIMLVALAIEPNAQQILEPLSRQAPLPNVTAQIGRAQNYSSRAIRSGSLNSYGVGSIPEVNFRCPQTASRCTWNQFTTLTVCSSFENFADIMKPAYNNETFHDTYIYSFPKGDDVIMLSAVGGSGGTALFNTSGSIDSSNSVFEAVVNGARTTFSDENIQTFTMTWTWRLKTYHSVVASPAGIEEVDYMSEPLLLDDIIPHGMQPWGVYYASSSGENFNITTSLGSGLWQYLDKLFTRELQSPLTRESVETDFSMGEFMYFTDLANLMKNTYWHVRWGWITLPVMEVLLAALLLAITIMWTSNQPLFKSSALALLYHGFDRHDEAESLLEEQDSMDELEDMVKGIGVEFKKAENGVLKFVRIGGTGY